MTQDAYWEHFEHGADVGIRGCGPSVAKAFEQAALALTAVIVDPSQVRESVRIELECEAEEPEILFVDWLNALVYEMAVNRLLFARYHVEINGRCLHGAAWGEAVDPERHRPAVEVKGATYTCLAVGRRPEGGWLAQTVVDV